MGAQRKPPRILIIGRNGQVSWELRRTLQSLGEIISLGRQELDLTDIHGLRETVRDLKPAVIVNAAAYTAVDRAETEVDIARAVNATAPAVLADEAHAIGALLLHYSTDYVFDGTSRTPYLESDDTNPQSVYGVTKLEGEQAIADSGVRYLLLRTSWVYGARGGNFLLTILRLAQQRQHLSVVDDQFGAPTWSRTIAEATTQIISQYLAPEGRDALNDRLDRIYHLTAGGEVSWYGFAKAFVKMAEDRGDLLALRNLQPIPSSEYPVAAVRPAYSCLSTTAVARNFAVHLPAWEVALEMVMDAGAGRPAS